MPAEVGGRSTAAMAVLSVFTFLIGLVCVFAGVLLVACNTSTVHDALTNASNLPLRSDIVAAGITPLVIVAPQAIILPSIFGMIAACSRRQCGYATYLVFSILSALWTPVQTAAALLFAACYAIVYSANIQDSAKSDLSMNVLTVTLCLLGLFAGSIVCWMLTIIGSIFGCCNTCCRKRLSTRQRSEEEVPLLASVDGRGVNGVLFRPVQPPDAATTFMDARFVPYMTACPPNDSQGYAVLMMGAAPPAPPTAGWQYEREPLRTSAAPPAPPPPPPPPQELSATGTYERRFHLNDNTSAAPGAAANTAVHSEPSSYERIARDRVSLAATGDYERQQQQLLAARSAAPAEPEQWQQRYDGEAAAGLKESAADDVCLLKFED